jgi:hypothetical protein
MAFVAVGTGLGLGAAAAAAGVGTTSAIAIGAAGASIVGSSLAAKKGAAAAKSAARTQAEAQGRAIDEQRRQFDQIREILAPYISAGRPDLTQPYIGAGPGAIRGLQALTGLGGEAARQEALARARQSPEFTQLSQLSDITKSNVDEYIRNREQELALFKKSAAYKKPTLAEGQKGKMAVRQAREDLIAQFQQESDKNVRDIQAKGQAEQYAKQQALLTPILEDKQYEQMGIDQQRQAIQQIEQGPLFQELAKQGEAGLLATASATGRRGAEDTQSALARYRPQLLNQLIDQQYARLAGLTSVGQSGAQNLLNLGQASAAGQAGSAAQSGNAISGILSSQGAAQAAGIMGAGQAQAQGIGGIGSAISGGFQNYALLNMLGSGGGGLGTGGFYKTAAEATAAGGGAPVAYFGGDSPSAAHGFYIQS